MAAYSRGWNCPPHYIYLVRDILDALDLPPALSHLDSVTHPHVTVWHFIMTLFSLPGLLSLPSWSRARETDLVILSSPECPKGSSLENAKNNQM